MGTAVQLNGRFNLFERALKGRKGPIRPESKSEIPHRTGKISNLSSCPFSWCLCFPLSSPLE